jgi:hypothetical protein
LKRCSRIRPVEHTSGEEEGTHFAAEAGHGNFEEVSCVVPTVLYPIGDLVEMLDGNGACAVEAIRNPDRVEAAIQERFALFQQRAS